MINKKIKNKNWLIFLFLLTGYNVLTFLSNKYILTDNLFYYSYGNQLTAKRIAYILSLKSNLGWLSYVIVSLSFIIKISIITIVLYTGTILSNLEIELKNLFRIVLQAEFLFLFVFFIRIYWVYFFMTDVSLMKLEFFQPLSILNFFTMNEIPKWLVYPLQLVNLFELGYWLLLADLLKDVIKKSFWKSFEFVQSTYGVGLIIWVAFVVFLTLNFS